VYRTIKYMKTVLYTLGTLILIFNGFSYCAGYASGVAPERLNSSLILMGVGIVLLIIPRFIKKDK